ncbi:MAG: serine hydrolase [Planctomycetales bacterium]|nr:serine hydrolase [Planctomycetales bacterium]
MNLCDAARAEETAYPGASWETRSPDEVGLDTAKLQAFAKAVGGDGVVIRDGYLVASWGDAMRHGDWASAAKPVLSTLLLFAVQEHRIDSVDDPLRPWVQRRLPGKDLIEKDRTITFRHLADMTSGYRRAEPPGTHWAYNDSAIALYVHMTVAVWEMTPNQAVLRCLAPLEFEDGDIFASRGGNGVSASPRDFARIGWFWLNRGNWRGEQLLRRDLFDDHCRPDVPVDLPRTKADGVDYLSVGTTGGGPDQSEDGPGVYGFNWWFNAVGPDGQRFMPHLPDDAYQADGHWGKECMLIIPSQRMVVAARGNWGGTRLDKTRLLIDAIEE